MRTLCLEPVNDELHSITNLTRRNKTYKSEHREIDYHIDIKNILYIIIDKLDLTDKRYKLCDDEMEKEGNKYHRIEDRFKKCIDNGNEEINTETQINEALSLQLAEEQTCELSDLLFENCKFDAVTSASAVQEKGEPCSFYTLDYIINHLKLEDSHTLSSPRSEASELVKSVYFFEKCGLLLENDKQYCALHIPPIRKGYVKCKEY